MYNTILHATDLSENHFDLCQKAVLLAKTLKAELHFLHVIEIPASLQFAQGLGFAELATPIKDGAQAVMSVLGETLKIPAKNLHIEIGSAYTHILSFIKEHGCDLVLLGKHTPHSLTGFAGSTTSAVMHHADCDVLTLRTA